jgi:hypothetical protein
MRSPFKFLDPFRQEDAGEFFGRDNETRDLYDFVNKNRLVLVYGTSGTGKTSLVQCGLSSRFDSTDWFPLFIRRGHNINDALRDGLTKHEAAKSPDESISPIVARLNYKCLRPVYLIFDQLEELLILGSEMEQKKFIATIRELLQEPELDCHILFILREEYLARLYDFEKEIPTLFDRRLRVESMGKIKLTEVILGSMRKFNITLEDSTKNAEQIMASLNAGKSGISLPYLQVYLDMLWRKDYERDYPHENPENLEAKLARKEYPALTFTTAEIEAFGQIENVLTRFLSEQTALIQKEVRKSNPDSEEVVNQILDAFVTEEGTKRPAPYTRQQNQIVLGDRAPGVLRSLPTALTSQVLLLLEKSRILRFTEDSIELAHDALAALIDQQRSDAQRRLNELHNRLKNNYREYLDNKEYLSRKQLTALENYLPQLKPLLEKPVQDFIEASFDNAKRVEQAAVAARVRRPLIILSTSLTVISMIGFVRSNRARERAIAALAIAEKEIVKREQLQITDYLQKGKNFTISGDYDLTLNVYNYLLDSMFSKEAHKSHIAKPYVENEIQICKDSLNKK